MQKPFKAELMFVRAKGQLGTYLVEVASRLGSVTLGSSLVQLGAKP